MSFSIYRVAVEHERYKFPRGYNQTTSKFHKPNKVNFKAKRIETRRINDPLSGIVSTMWPMLGIGAIYCRVQDQRTLCRSCMCACWILGNFLLIFIAFSFHRFLVLLLCCLQIHSFSHSLSLFRCLLAIHLNSNLHNSVAHTNCLCAWYSSLNITHTNTHIAHFGWQMKQAANCTFPIWPLHYTRVCSIICIIYVYIYRARSSFYEPQSVENFSYYSNNSY